MAGYPYYQPYQQPYFPAPAQVQAPPAQAQPGPSFALVNNEQEARDFMVLPGNSVYLMSRNEPVFWVKTTDHAGLSAPLRTFDFTERQTGPAQAPQAQAVGYVPRSDYDALEARVAALEGKECGCKKKEGQEDG